MKSLHTLHLFAWIAHFRWGGKTPCAPRNKIPIFSRECVALTSQRPPVLKGFLPKLVGGWTNPCEKYARQIGSFRQVGVKMKNMWNHQLGNYDVSWNSSACQVCSRQPTNLNRLHTRSLKAGPWKWMVGRLSPAFLLGPFVTFQG